MGKEKKEKALVLHADLIFNWLVLACEILNLKILKLISPAPFLSPGVTNNAIRIPHVSTPHSMSVGQH